MLEPIRTLGEFEVPVHLTIDLIPLLQVIVHREGEAVKHAPQKLPNLLRLLPRKHLL